MSKKYIIKDKNKINQILNIGKINSKIVEEAKKEMNNNLNKLKDEPKHIIKYLGEIYHNVMVIDLHEKREKCIVYKCRCLCCGEYFYVKNYSLKHNSHCLCKKCKRPKIILDGKTFGKLKALRTFSKNNKSKTLCYCECGNYCIVPSYNLTHNRTHSCGCLIAEACRKTGSKEVFKEGYITNDWKLLKKIIKKNKKGEEIIYWECECLCCGDIRTIKQKSIYKTLCKKKRKEIIDTKKRWETERYTTKTPEYIEDYTGKVFGKLKVLGFCGFLYHKKAGYWLCECQCKNKTICVVSGQNLKTGTTKSCGCLHSKGELEIKFFLKNNHIKFVSQKTFSNCKNINVLRFDFQIFYINSNKWFLCEYQGIQHYEPSSFSNEKSKEKKLQNLKQNQLKDNIKRQYCKNNNIELLEIPYWDFDNIEKILADKIGIKLSDDELNESTN